MDFDAIVVGSGFGGTVAGLAGAVVLVPPSTEPELPFGARKARMVSEIEVTMKITAEAVVALESSVAAPRGPKAVWLPMPPKAAAISALLPLCSSTTTIRNTQTIT